MFVPFSGFLIHIHSYGFFPFSQIDQNPSWGSDQSEQEGHLHELWRQGGTYTVGGKGSRATVGIPGTGLSYSSVRCGKNSSNLQSQASDPGKSKSGCGCATLIGILLVVGILSSQTERDQSTASPTKPSNVIGDVQSFAPTAKKTATEIAQIQKFVPSVLTLKTPVSAPLTENGQTVGVTMVPKGTKVRVSTISGATAIVESGGSPFSVAIFNTDFLEQVLDNAKK